MSSHAYKIAQAGWGRIAPFYSIDEKHSHLSNVLRECKILYQHTFKVGIRKNAHWHNNEKKKKKRKEKKRKNIIINSIKMGRLISASVRFGFYS